MHIPKLNSILTPPEPVSDETPSSSQPLPAKEFTVDQVKEVWKEFASQRIKYKAEYQLLSQDIELNENTILVHLHNPVQETLLNDLKVDITAFIREKLSNHHIHVVGEHVGPDEKKVIYTNREKFEHLAEKNPALKELKDRLGLDTDF